MALAGTKCPNRASFIRSGAWLCNNADKRLETKSGLGRKRRQEVIHGYIFNICGKDLAVGVEFIREIKSGKVFLTPGKKVVVIPRELLKVSDSNTNDNALLFAVAEAAFFVHERAVILSASI